MVETTEQLEAMLAKTEAYQKLKKLYPDLDFLDAPIDGDFPEHIKNSIAKTSKDVEDPLKMKEAPVLNTDFSMFIIVVGMPVITPEKKDKL